jgi:aryl-alcohol dehydrogenase-like predicted oxidoreductase
MEKIRLGRTGMIVTRLGFGGIPIQRLNEDDAVKVIKRCLDLGINFLDTANGYSTSEERIGKAIKGHRQGVFIATKSGARTGEDI